MIHVCFNLDEKYVMPCKVLIKQIDALTSDKVTYHFIGIDKRDMETNSKCEFYPNPDLSYFTDENLGDYHYFSQAAMYRLLIPFLIKTDRAIYMDIDIIVLKDLKLLWDKEIDYVGAVIDPNERFRKRVLGIDSEYYFNSGLILFDSKKIRQNIPDYKQRILQAQKDYVLSLKDQDIFNIIFKNHITSLGYNKNIVLCGVEPFMTMGHVVVANNQNADYIINRYDNNYLYKLRFLDKPLSKKEAGCVPYYFEYGGLDFIEYTMQAARLITAVLNKKISEGIFVKTGNISEKFIKEKQLILNDMTRTYIDYYNLKSYYTYKFNEKEAYWEEYDIYI